jgi:hypothetical protein
MYCPLRKCVLDSGREGADVGREGADVGANRVGKPISDGMTVDVDSDGL